MSSREHRRGLPHAQDVLRTLGPMLVAGSLVGCGPSVSGSGNSDADGGSGSDAESATSTGGPAGSTGTSSDEETSGASTGEEPFACERGEELLPGLCFDRYPVELPGPLVGDRATGANLDAEGGDELVVELLLDTEKTLVMLAFDPDSGMTLQQEALPTFHPDLETTQLLTAEVKNDAGDEVVRTMDDALNICGLDEEGVFVCEAEPAGADELVPACPVSLESNSPGVPVRSWLISSAPEDFAESGYGLSIWALGVGATGTFGRGAYPVPACHDLLAVSYGDINGDGFVDIVHRSSVDCVGSGDPRRDDLNVLVGFAAADFEEPPPADTGVEPSLLVVLDVDGDGNDDVLVVDVALGSNGYRLLLGAAEGLGAPEPVVGPDAAQRLALAQLQAEGPPRVVVSRRESTSVISAVLDAYDSLDLSLGRLLAVADVDGDGRDDLILSGGDEQVLELLVVTD